MEYSHLSVCTTVAFMLNHDALNERRESRYYPLIFNTQVVVVGAAQVASTCSMGGGGGLWGLPEVVPCGSARRLQQGTTTVGAGTTGDYLVQGPDPRGLP